MAKLMEDAGETPEPPKPTMHMAKHLAKTRLCKHFLRGFCRYQEKCAYAHDVEELMPRPNLTKTRICINFLSGKCTDSLCSYAHGMAELRQDKELTAPSQKPHPDVKQNHQQLQQLRNQIKQQEHIQQQFQQQETQEKKLQQLKEELAQLHHQAGMVSQPLLQHQLQSQQFQFQQPQQRLPDLQPMEFQPPPQQQQRLPEFHPMEFQPQQLQQQQQLPLQPIEQFHMLPQQQPPANVQPMEQFPYQTQQAPFSSQLHLQQMPNTQQQPLQLPQSLWTRQQDEMQQEVPPQRFPGQGADSIVALPAQSAAQPVPGPPGLKLNGAQSACPQASWGGNVDYNAMQTQQGLSQPPQMPQPLRMQHPVKQQSEMPQADRESPAQFSQSARSKSPNRNSKSRAEDKANSQELWNHMTKGQPATQHDAEDFDLLQETLGEIMQLLVEETEANHEALPPDRVSKPCMRWASLSLSLLSHQFQSTLLEGKCLVANSGKKKLSRSEEDLVIYILLNQPSWISIFPALTKLCAAQMAMRMVNSPHLNSSSGLRRLSSGAGEGHRSGDVGDTRPKSSGGILIASSTGQGSHTLDFLPEPPRAT